MVAMRSPPIESGYRVWLRTESPCYQLVVRGSPGSARPLDSSSLLNVMSTSVPASYGREDRTLPTAMSPENATCMTLSTACASSIPALRTVTLMPPSARRCVARIDIRPRARPRLENHGHPLDRGHLVLVRALDLVRRDREHRSRYDVGRTSGEPGHTVLRLAPDRNHRLVLDLQSRHLEPAQPAPPAGQSPPDRRRLHPLTH